MKTEGILFGLLSAFLGGAAVTYWYLATEPVGTTALALSAGLAGLIAYYSLFLSRRMGPRPEDRPDAEIADAAGEVGFFSPHSWWPLIGGLASAMLALGIVFGWWLFFIGAFVQICAVIGFLFQYEPRATKSHG